MRSELKKIKTICDDHETLCQSFAQWKKDVDENDAQLRILNATAASLRKRHRAICEQIKKKPSTVHSEKKKVSVVSEEVDRLQREISFVEAEVDVWMKELAEVNDARTNLDIQFIQLRSKLQRSMTNVEVANIDFDLLEKNHCATWKNFLCKTENFT
ncbi:unnamed protein product [Enterobius vermicularis]|uniref:Tektin n=1 Tax=Enterobius vermicularis TaxID=51028 RepID=A0A0N4VIA2_ENTVE|nr:unnamed protein product [Enterobius vermicularis]